MNAFMLGSPTIQMQPQLEFSCLDLPAVGFAPEAKEVAGHFAHLDLFGPFCNAVAAVMSINVLERHVAAVSDSPTCLHGPIRCITRQSIRTVIAHGD